MTSNNQFLLHEDASGYALFRCKEGLESFGFAAGGNSAAVDDYTTFKALVELTAFHRFESAEEALEEIKAISIGQVSAGLENFLDLNLRKQTKKKGANNAYTLGVWDAELGKQLNEKFPSNAGAQVKELLRGCLLHFHHYVKASQESPISQTDLSKAQCGLAHCYSRDKMQLDPNRQDKPIMNTIAILDNLDKNINQFAMRVKEWYAWHFPELAKILSDNIVYAKVARVVRIRDSFDQEAGKPALVDAVGGSDEIAEEVLAALRISMGQDIVEMDMANIDNFALQVVELAQMRSLLQEYLKRKMDVVAPNLSSLIGEAVGARLISHAGSLINLAKYPASTVQILGAEKALFRALKTKGNTPKYGLLYHSSFIGRAQQKNKGRISRYLANKCSIASRVDCFGAQSTKVFGECMKQQCEDRLAFLTEGVKPRKNVDVMSEAMKAVAKEALEAGSAVGTPAPKEKKSKKREAEVEAPATEEPAKKKKKKEKKEKEGGESAEAVKEAAVAEGEGKKNKKKSKA